MAKAQFKYAVGLNTDVKTYGRVSYDTAIGMLKDFLAAHNGEYLGAFEQDGVQHPEYAVVKMTKRTAEALESLNVKLLYSDDDQPFVARILGECFDISFARDLSFGPDPAEAFFRKGVAECTI